MSKYDGKNEEFTFGAFTIPDGYLVTVDWPQSRDELEATGATQLDKEFYSSERSSTVTINCWDDAAGTIRTAFSVTSAEASGVYYPQGNTTGKPKRTANMFVTSVSDPLTHNQIAAITITLRVNGAVTHSTVV